MPISVAYTNFSKYHLLLILRLLIFVLARCDTTCFEALASIVLYWRTFWLSQFDIFFSNKEKHNLYNYCDKDGRLESLLSKNSLLSKFCDSLLWIFTKWIIFCSSLSKARKITVLFGLELEIFKENLKLFLKIYFCSTSYKFRIFLSLRLRVQPQKINLCKILCVWLFKTLYWSQKRYYEFQLETSPCFHKKIYFVLNQFEKTFWKTVHIHFVFNFKFFLSQNYFSMLPEILLVKNWDLQIEKPMIVNLYWVCKSSSKTWGQWNWVCEF